jgi:hypothetical protein
MQKIVREKFMKVIVPVVALSAVVIAGYLYMQVRTLKQNPQAVAQKEVADLVAKVSKLAVLPLDETPTVATVSDPEALKDQVFFASAQKGDKVLIYAQAKKAILYSVTMNKIIDVAPLNIGTQKSVTPPATKTTTDDKKDN